MRFTKSQGFVSTNGLTANPDNLNLNSETLYTFGLRYFDKYQEIVKNI